MKLEMTLPERPGFLHAVPVLNLFALLLLFLLLSVSSRLPAAKKLPEAWIIEHGSGLRRLCVILNFHDRRACCGIYGGDVFASA